MREPVGLTRLAFSLAAMLGFVVAIAGCKANLPEPDSYAGQLYVKRCGGCHQPYSPRALTPAMWEAQVDAMAPRLRQAGVAPLTAEERQVIVDYLTRNAGAQ